MGHAPHPNHSTLPVTHKHMHTQLHQSYTKHPPAKDPYSSKAVPSFKPCPPRPALQKWLALQWPCPPGSHVIQWQNKDYFPFMRVGGAPAPPSNLFVHTASYVHSTIILTQMNRCTYSLLRTLAKSCSPAKACHPGKSCHSMKPCHPLTEYRTVMNNGNAFQLHIKCT